MSVLFSVWPLRHRDIYGRPLNILTNINSSIRQESKRSSAEFVPTLSGSHALHVAPIPFSARFALHSVAFVWHSAVNLLSIRLSISVSTTVYIQMQAARQAHSAEKHFKLLPPHSALCTQFTALMMDSHHSSAIETLFFSSRRNHRSIP